MRAVDVVEDMGVSSFKDEFKAAFYIAGLQLVGKAGFYSACYGVVGGKQLERVGYAAAGSGFGCGCRLLVEEEGNTT
jgi:hypothetical protein